MTAADRDSVIDFFASMGEKSASFFNVGHGNEKRVLGGIDGTVTGHRFFVAENDNRLIGIMFLWDIKKTVPWFGIAVRDSVQGQGVGTVMMNYLRSFAMSNGYAGVLLRTAQSNLAAQHLYEKSGFEKLGVHHSGEFLYMLRFEREI